MLPSGPIKIKNVQIIPKNFVSVNVQVCCKGDTSYLGKAFMCAFNEVRIIFFVVADLFRFTKAKVSRMVQKF